MRTVCVDKAFVPSPVWKHDFRKQAVQGQPNIQQGLLALKGPGLCLNVIHDDLYKPMRQVLNQYFIKSMTLNPYLAQPLHEEVKIKSYVISLIIYT
jgi:hypothetical protein